jgi:mannosylglycerate hydrolase MGH1-like protein
MVQREMDSVLSELRSIDVEKRAGGLERAVSRNSLSEFVQSGVKFAASPAVLEDVYYSAVHALMGNIYNSVSGTPLLIEGDVYVGCWLESTGTILTEILSRFCPETAQACFEIFADHQREDGLIPYKLTDKGPSYRQIQMVTPLARSVWSHYCRNGRDRQFLAKMYDAMSRNDEWLARYRNTRGTGCVEAFCTFDTGNDRSPRFWHVNDTPFMADPARYDPDSPILPFLAPDLTANVHCQRKYLQLMADELGRENTAWDKKAEQSLKSLMTYCYDEKDHFFYDRDRNDQFVRVQSDVLMRVMASEVGDATMFEDALRRYLLNTKKFFARYPLTTIALDEPGYDHNAIRYNSWAGVVSYLTEIRLPHAFEYHHRYVELSWIIQPVLSALARVERFSGGMNAWTGTEGDSGNYSGTMVCLLDYIERFSGIHPTTGSELWFTTLIPYGQDFGAVVAKETGYARTVDGVCFELVNKQDGSSVYRDEDLLCSVPRGVRLVTDRRGDLRGLIGMSVRTITGEIVWKDRVIPFSAAGNERLEYTGAEFVSVANPGVVTPRHGRVCGSLRAVRGRLLVRRGNS